MNYGPFTIVIIILTLVLSIPALSDDTLKSKLMLWPYKMRAPREYYRFLSSGFVHNDVGHLFFNMFALLGFGTFAETAFSSFSTPWLYLFFYLSAIIASELPTFSRKRNTPNYRSLGASGGIAAILFCCVYFNPWGTVSFIFLPIPIPSILFAVLYLVYSAWAAKRSGDNIAHDVHFWGAVYGFLFTLIVEPTHGLHFLRQLMEPHYSFGRFQF